MYFRHLILLIFCCCVTLLASAQQLYNISGIVYKKSYSERVAQVTVSNLNRPTTATTDNFGVFHIQAAKGDTLAFRKIDYTPEFFVIQGPFDVNIYMRPVIALDEVTVRDQSKKQELNEVMDQYRKQGTFYNGKPKALSFLASPLTGVYELFGKTPKRARHFKEYSKNELEQLEINKRYNKSVIKQLTDIPDNEIEDFMNAFTPSYTDIKEWNDYDLIKYVKKSAEYYKENKNTMKRQKLY